MECLTVIYWMPSEREAMFAYLYERLLAFLSLFGRRPEPARVELRVTPLEAIIAARRNARR